METKEIKQIIIENFIDYYTTNESERDHMKECLNDYIEEDWVDEIQNYIDEIKKIRYCS